MIFLKRLNEWPIQKKLIYSNMISIALAFVPVIIILLSYEYIALRKVMQDDIRLQANIVGESSAAAMAFRDNKAAHDTLSALKKSHDLIEAHLILSDGSVLGSIYSGQNVPLKSTHTYVTKILTEEMTLNSITLKKPIYLRSEFVGVLVLKNSLDSFYRRLSLYGLIVLSVAGFGFLLARWIAGRISRTITEPLMHLIEVTQKVTSEQDYTALIPIESKDEVGNLSRAFGEMMLQIHKRDLSMQQLAYYDHVSGIANRHYFEERIKQTVGNAERYGTSCYLLIIDLDDFKIVNDNFGHHIGDMLLNHIAKSMLQTLRQNDSIFRVGGDEFAVIIENISDLESIERIAQKIISAVSTPIVLEGHLITVGASIGISYFPKLAVDVRSLLETADEAMYEAKANGKNNFKIYHL